jgi:hypothetical protein
VIFLLEKLLPINFAVGHISDSEYLSKCDLFQKQLDILNEWRNTNFGDPEFDPKSLTNSITLITDKGFRNNLEAARHDTQILSAPLASSTASLSVLAAYQTCFIAANRDDSERAVLRPFRFGILSNGIHPASRFDLFDLHWSNANAKCNILYRPVSAKYSEHFESIRFSDTLPLSASSPLVTSSEDDTSVELTSDNHSSDDPFRSDIDMLSEDDADHIPNDENGNIIHDEEFALDPFSDETPQYTCSSSSGNPTFDLYPCDFQDELS